MLLCLYIHKLQVHKLLWTPCRGWYGRGIDTSSCLHFYCYCYGFLWGLNNTCIHMMSTCIFSTASKSCMMFIWKQKQNRWEGVYFRWAYPPAHQRARSGPRGGPQRIHLLLLDLSPWKLRFKYIATSKIDWMVYIFSGPTLRPTIGPRVVREVGRRGYILSCWTYLHENRE